MDYGIENTTHDKAYFDEIDIEAEKEIWLETRTAEIAAEIMDSNHELYSAIDCLQCHIIDDDDCDERIQLNAALVSCASGLQIGLAGIKRFVNFSVDKQARILAEGELAAMENKDDH